jgi:hypothetical protein
LRVLDHPFPVWQQARAVIGIAVNRKLIFCQWKLF